MKTLERILVRVDQAPADAILRLVVGYLIVPAWLALGSEQMGWALIPFFLSVLIALRVVPLVLRKCIPFSSSAQDVWYERRQLAKRFDSYQWQKLFWIGLGLLLYTFQSSRQSVPLLTVTFVSLLAGLLGQLVWRYRATQREDPSATGSSRDHARAVHGGPFQG
jgi:hypothetical protein